MVKGHQWLAVGVAGISLVIPGIATAQNRAPAEQPLGQPGAVAPGGTGSGAALPQAQGSFKAPAQIRPGQAISVLVFPFGFLGAEAGAAAAPAAGAPPADNGAAPATGGLTQEQQHVASYLTAAVKAGFLSSPFYSVASYHPNSSLIQRAQKDEILRPEHVQNLLTPATGGPDLERARTVTYRLGMQGMLVGTIDLKTDAKANTSEVTLETQLINSTTGEVIRSAAVSGAAAGAAGVPVEVVEERAAQDAAMKVLPALGIQLVALPSDGAAPAKGASKAQKSTGSSDKDAKKAAADAKKAEEAAKRQAKEDSEKAERVARDQAKAAEKAKRDAAKKSKPEKSAAASVPAVAPKIQQDAPAAPAPAGTPAPAEVAPEGVVSNTVPGTSNSAGQPVPYGYALGDTRGALPQRDRGGLKVPAWMGVAAFLYGLTFLVY